MADTQYDGLYIRPQEMSISGDLNTYNLKFYDYQVPAMSNDKHHDLIQGIEWLTMVCCLWRAHKIEEEIPPQADYIQYRSECMEECGKALAKASAIDASLKEMGDKGSVPESVYTALSKYTSYSFPEGDTSKGEIQKACQHLRNAIDLMDNDSQMDNTRLQSLLEKRNSAYNSASEFLTKINSNISMGISILAN